ncbi:Type 1 glutamine amidotransferase-like domain-containing protein [Streptomyces sp. NPDC002611]
MATAVAVQPPQRLALLGGGFSTDDDGLLDDWVLARARVPRPKVCFVPTASGDAPAYVEQFRTAFRSVSPHYDSEPGRRPSYRAAVAAGRLPAGWAVEDGAGVLFTQGVPTEAVARVPGAEVYRVEPDGSGVVCEQGLRCRVLTPSHPRPRTEQ